MTNSKRDPATAPDLEKLQARLRTSRILNVLLAVVAVFLLVVVLAGNRTSQFGSDEAAVAEPGAAPADTQDAAEGEQDQGMLSHIRADADDPLAIGDIDAPVVMSEWTDYRCPFCAVFANDTLPTLITEYVDKGKLRIEFHDVYFFGEDSKAAAIAARAAAAQGYYLPYIQALYAAAPESGHPDLPREKLIEFAREAGVPNLEQFTEDLDSPTLAAEVDQSQQQAVGWGINSVPFFVIGDQALSGAQPLDVFQQVIDQQLDADN